MTEPRDPLEAWLGEQVRPLPPRPEAFEQIRKRARRRKLRQVAVSAAATAAAVVIAAAAPGLISAQFPSGPLASPSQPAAHPPARSPAPSAAARATPSRARRVPAGFRPSSITFIGTNTGWVLGQAGRCLPQSTAACTVLARTQDTGASWRTVAAPPAGAPDGAGGVSQVRFLNGQDGWVFGPQLWATHDGGRSWREVNTGGRRVTALETAGQPGRAFALWATCAGGGAGFASRCTSYSLYSTPAKSDRWAPVPGVPALSAGQGPASAALVLGAKEGYLLAPNGVLLTGPVSGGRWRLAGGGVATPCAPGAAQPSGQPSGAMLATTGQGLLLLCAGPAAGGVQHKTLYYSPDAGQTWQPPVTAPSAGIAQSLSGSPSGAYLVATDQGVEVSNDSGATWQAASGPIPPGGFSYLGMTFPLQGVAVPAGPGQHALWITGDGGRSWQKHSLR